MRLYKITACTNTAEAKTLPTLWAGSQTEAAKARKQMLELDASRATTETFELDIPTNKDGLLEWLRANVK